MNQEDWNARQLECPLKPNYKVLQNDPFSKLVKEFGRAHENKQFALAKKNSHFSNFHHSQTPPQLQTPETHSSKISQFANC